MLKLLSKLVSCRNTKVDAFDKYTNNVRTITRQIITEYNTCIIINNNNQTDIIDSVRLSDDVIENKIKYFNNELSWILDRIIADLVSINDNAATSRISDIPVPLENYIRNFTIPIDPIIMNKREITRIIDAIRDDYYEKLISKKREENIRIIRYLAVFSKYNKFFYDIVHQISEFIDVLSIPHMLLELGSIDSVESKGNKNNKPTAILTLYKLFITMYNYNTDNIQIIAKHITPLLYNITNKPLFDNHIVDSIMKLYLDQLKEPLYKKIMLILKVIQDKLATNKNKLKISILMTYFNNGILNILNILNILSLQEQTNDYEDEMTDNICATVILIILWFNSNMVTKDTKLNIGKIDELVNYNLYYTNQYIHTIYCRLKYSEEIVKIRETGHSVNRNETQDNHGNYNTRNIINVYFKITDIVNSRGRIKKFANNKYTHLFLDYFYKLYKLLCKDATEKEIMYTIDLLLSDNGRDNIKALMDMDVDYNWNYFYNNDDYNVLLTYIEYLYLVMRMNNIIIEKSISIKNYISRNISLITEYRCCAIGMVTVGDFTIYDNRNDDIYMLRNTIDKLRETIKSKCKIF
jgi:hypothetical protein